MTYLLISKILREKLLNFKVGAIVNYPKHKRRKEKKKYKKSTHENYTWNSEFCLTKLTKLIKKF